MPIEVFTRWFHIWFAAILIGGAVFQWFALGPAVKLLPDEQKMLMRERIASRWGMVVGIGTLMLLLTGFYNYLSVKRDSQYHMLMGCKILLALPIFFLAAVLSGRSLKFEKWRRRAPLLLLVLILMQAGVVMIAGYLKVMRSPAAAPVIIPGKTTTPAV
jgi:uncharacterized membrane protein